jgi:hypothetical protein
MPILQPGHAQVADARCGEQASNLIEQSFSNCVRFMVRGKTANLAHDGAPTNARGRKR